MKDYKLEIKYIFHREIKYIFRQDKFEKDLSKYILQILVNH